MVFPSALKVHLNNNISFEITTITKKKSSRLIYIYLYLSILCAVMCHYCFFICNWFSVYCAVCHCACEECIILKFCLFRSAIYLNPTVSRSNHTECQADLITANFTVLVRALFIHEIEIKNNYWYENCTIQCQKLVMQKMDFINYTRDYIMTQKPEIRKHKQRRLIRVTVFTRPSFILTLHWKAWVLGRLSFRVWC